MATGSEVELIYKAWDVLQEKGVDARVISMPSWEIFEEQSDKYKESVIPSAVRKRVAVEAASDFGWYKYTDLTERLYQCMVTERRLLPDSFLINSDSPLTM